MTTDAGKPRIAEVEALKNVWHSLMPKVKVPSDAEFDYWLSRNDLAVVWRGIEKTARKNARTGFESEAHPVKYLSAVLSGMARRRIYVEEQNERRQHSD
jgi:hypothetical protein